MDGMIVMAYIFGMVGIAAFVQTQKLTRTLKEKGVLEENPKEN